MNVAEWMVKRGYSQAALAKLIGVAPSKVSAVLSGKGEKKFNVRDAVRIRELSGGEVTLDDVLVAPAGSARVRFKRGRPTLRARKRMVYFRVTDEEYAWLQSASRSRRARLSEFLRIMLEERMTRDRARSA